MKSSKFGKLTVMSASSAVIFDMHRYAAKPMAVADTNPPSSDTVPSETGIDSINYSKWGDDNLLPKTMVEDIKSCGILTGGIDTKIRFGLGTGPEPYKLVSKGVDGQEELAPINDPEIADWMSENNIYASCFGWMQDLVGLGQDLTRLKYNRAGTKIGLMWRHDVAEMRLQKKDSKGQIKKVYLSADWDKGVQNDGLITLDLIPSVGPRAYLGEYKENQLRSKEFAFITRLPDWLKHYYSDPKWLSARKWVEIAKNVPAMKAAMFENNIRLKYKVVIMEEYWENRFPDWDDADEKKCEGYRSQVYDEIDSFLVGSENAYKSIFVDGKFMAGADKRFEYIDIVPIKDETKQGELLPDSAAANFEILFSIGMSPALIGMNVLGGGQYGGGAGSGSDIREAALVQMMIQSFERQSISRKLDLVSHVNGWKQRHANMVWRFPGLVLTTLDKGKSAEPVNNQ